MANQIPVIAILMIVQGVFECLLALLLITVGAILPAFADMAEQAARQQAPRGAPFPGLPAEFVQFAAAAYLIAGAVVLLAGALRIIAGIRNLKYRGRTFGIVSLAAGAVTALTCYCAPTSIGLLIYGLIVYLNAESARAFALGEQGKSPEEIKVILREERAAVDPPWRDRDAGPPPPREPPPPLLPPPDGVRPT